MALWRTAIAAGCGFLAAAAKSRDSQAYSLQMHERDTGPLFSDKYRAFRLGEVINLAEDVAIFRFLTPHAEDEFFLPVSSTLLFCDKKGVMAVDNVTRMYTPITPNGTKGYFDVLVKKQRRGRMTETLFGMSIGDTMLMRKVEYSMRYVPNKFQHIGMIGGGTGITPLLQVMGAVTRNPQDHTKMTLLFANRDERKILLEGVLRQMEAENPDKLRCFFTVDRPHEPDQWKGFSGHITKEMIQATMPPPDKGNYLLVCGPDAMLENLAGVKTGVLQAMSGGRSQQPAASNANNMGDVGGILGDLGYTKDTVFRF